MERRALSETELREVEEGKDVKNEEIPAEVLGLEAENGKLEIGTVFEARFESRRFRELPERGFRVQDFKAVPRGAVGVEGVANFRVLLLARSICARYGALIHQ